jgi:hypothetical protein
VAGHGKLEREDQILILNCYQFSELGVDD